MPNLFQSIGSALTRLGTSTSQSGIATPFDSGNHLHTVTAADLYPGLDVSMLGVDRSGAMKIAAASKSRNLICNAIAGMPLQAFRGSKVLEDSQGSDLIRQPEVGRPRAITIAWTVDQMLWYGRAWWFISERYGTGRAKHVQLVMEQDIDYDPAARVVKAFGRSYPDTDFIRIDAMHEGVLNYAKDVFVRASLMEVAAAQASHSPVPSIELHQVSGEPLSKEQIDLLTARWIAARRNPNGGVAFTSREIETKTHGVAAEQLLIAGRNTAAMDVARSMGLPAWSVDASVEGSSLTYSNVPSRSRELLDYALYGYMDAISGRLSMDDVLPRGQWCAFSPARLLKGDFGDRMNAGKVAVDAGIYTADEVRQMEYEIPLEVD